MDLESRCIRTAAARGLEEAAARTLAAPYLLARDAGSGDDARAAGASDTDAITAVGLALGAVALIGWIGDMLHE